MLEKKYNDYLLSEYAAGANININQIIARLFKEKEIDLTEATRLKKNI